VAEVKDFDTQMHTDMCGRFLDLCTRWRQEVSLTFWPSLHQERGNIVRCTGNCSGHVHLGLYSDVSLYFCLDTMKNTKTLISASKKVGLEVNAEETKYLCSCHVTRMQTTVTNENWIQDEIKTRLNSGNACYHSVHSVSSAVENRKN
jgi:hypothetical protein